MIEFLRTKMGLKFFSVDFIQLVNACGSIASELKRSNDLREKELNLNERALKLDKMKFVFEKNKLNE